MSFFDGQPVGRILNRMTTDVNAVDMSIAMPLINLMGSGVFFFSSLIVMVYSSTYQLTAHISETLTGVQTINGFGVQEIFVKNAQLKIDMTNKSNLIMTSTQSWLAFRLDMLSAFVTLVLLLLAAGKVTDPANIGIALISALTLGAALNGLLQLISQVEASFNAVERLDYYAYQLPAEAEYLLPTDPKDKTWPSSGAIQIKNLELCYASRPNHPVIQDLTLSIAPGEKVGVVGRTGSGKSTLMLALFRILESSKGSIEVDGIDISTLGLTTLRSNMQIIPQDPVLFQGTVRSNLDILDKYTDEEIWNALSLVGLKDYISGLGEKLEDPILENGNNLSVGQRQLMCLCKAILAQPKILIMDEATASVDAEADRRIQESIEKQFQHTTILSIAHRLNTIAAFDRVLVLDQGAIVELDSPHVLLGRPESAFSGLVNATGQANAVVIREIAATHHSKKV
ncbi:hypothetical protein BASA62_010518 [Batrachochytrium salamandrivorans]|nr:hypothetical protein BASA62_010518 [Batrachochytrium salamandrivorans]